MALENYKSKMNEENKAKRKSQYTRATIIPLGNGKTKTVMERISREEYLTDEREEAYQHNPEDPTFESEMTGEDG
jgi:hypothetical protein